MWPFSSADPSSSTASTSNDNNAFASACPVNHTIRQRWLEQSQAFGDVPHGSLHTSGSQQGDDMRKLSEEREISSIPRYFDATGATQEPCSSSQDPTPPTTFPWGPAAFVATSARQGKEEQASPRSHWVYPSPSQFHAALVRKGHTSVASGANMDVVVPIHNAVNERCWEEILRWECNESATGAASWTTCGGPKLVSFKGRPAERTWKAWIKGVFGYQQPFDRHDWLVDRCGHRMRYIIDFYVGRPPRSGGLSAEANNPFLPGASTSSERAQKMSFYLDVRPAPDTFEGIAMRLKRTGREALALFRLVGEPISSLASSTQPAKRL